MHSLEKLTPLMQLEIWGMRVAGGSLKSPLAKATGGASGIDDELALAKWVESIEGFDQARELLAHVYSRFQPACSYRYRLPGESLFAAAIRHGQAQLVIEGAKEPCLIAKLHDGVMDRLIKLGRDRPFRAPARPREESVEEIVAQVEEFVSAHSQKLSA